MDLTREALNQMLKELQADILRKLTVHEVLATLSPTQRAAIAEAYWPPLKEYLKGVAPDELLAALSPEDRATLAQLLKDADVTEAPTSGLAPCPVLSSAAQ